MLLDVDWICRVSRIVNVEHEICTFFFDVSAFSLLCNVGAQAGKSQEFFVKSQTRVLCTL